MFLKVFKGSNGFDVFVFDFQYVDILAFSGLATVLATF
jgi:hypothetical protein